MQMLYSRDCDEELACETQHFPRSARVEVTGSTRAERGKCWVSQSSTSRGRRVCVHVPWGVLVLSLLIYRIPLNP